MKGSGAIRRSSIDVWDYDSRPTVSILGARVDGRTRTWLPYPRTISSLENPRLSIRLVIVLRVLLSSTPFPASITTILMRGS